MAQKEHYKKRFLDFMETLLPEDRIAVLHHTDPDGVCSGVIMAKLSEMMRGKPVDMHLNQDSSAISITDETIEELIKNRINKLIVTDLCIDQSPEGLKRIEDFASVLVMDHHKIYSDLNSQKTVMIKPQMISEIPPASYPASKLCFDMAMETADASGMAWIAAVGLVGDSSFRQWKDFVISVLRKNNIPEEDDPFDTSIGKAASIISDAECFDSKKAYDAFDVVYSAHSVDDVLSSHLRQFMEAVESEISLWISREKELAYHSGDIIFYVIKPKFGVKSPVSTKLSFEHPSSTVIVVEDRGNKTMNVSARRQDGKIAVNDLLEKAVAGLDSAVAGGHAPAAGGKIKSADIEKFREKILELA